MGAVHSIITLLAEMQNGTLDADNCNYRTDEYGRWYVSVGGGLLLRMDFLYMMLR